MTTVNSVFREAGILKVLKIPILRKVK